MAEKDLTGDTRYRLCNAGKQLIARELLQRRYRIGRCRFP